MRRLVGWFNHRDAVLAHLDALLLAYPRGRQFSDDFPQLKSALRASFEDGTPPALSALRIAEDIVASFVRQLDPERKAAVLAALTTQGRQGFADLTGRLVHAKPAKPDGAADFVTRLAGVALYLAGRLAEERALGPDDRRRFLASLAQELGADAGEEQALTEAFGAPASAASPK